ncbi:MAG: ferrous iron transport protein A [Planctomycetes bacterium]|nr:ferrous iron transport protein A [Planctomycetota bacterium]
MHGSMLPLTELPTGRRARLSLLAGERSFRRRLMELGLLPGTELCLVRRADLGGVLEVEVRRSRVTLRAAEAGALMVSPV